jgi:hypothetical protein
MAAIGSLKQDFRSDMKIAKLWWILTTLGPFPNPQE